MSDQQIEENIAVVIGDVCKHRNLMLGPFINRVTLALVPSRHFISIDVEKYVPKPTEAELEAVGHFCNSFIFCWFQYEERKGRKKKAKKAEKKEDETENEDLSMLAYTWFEFVFIVFIIV